MDVYYGNIIDNKLDIINIFHKNKVIKYLSLQEKCIFYSKINGNNDSDIDKNDNNENDKSNDNDNEKDNEENRRKKERMTVECKL